MAGLQQWDDHIWTLEGRPVSYHGVPFETRAVIVKLPNGRLWVHSPTLPADGVYGEVAALGQVGYLVAPNKIHSVGIRPWQALWPEAQTWVSPSFQRRHGDIPITHVLGDTAPSDWAGTIDQHVFAGHALLDEVVFLHVPSKTLIVTDFIQKHRDTSEPLYVCWLKRLAGIWGIEGGTAMDLRLSFLGRDAARASRDHILCWDFERLIISHGLCVRQGAKANVRKAWAWLK